MRRMTKVMNLLNTVPAQCPATPPPSINVTFCSGTNCVKK